MTQSGHFRIVTTLVGMTVTDCWRAHQQHLTHGHRHTSLTITEFTSILAKDCLENEFSRVSDVMFNIGEEEDPVSSLTDPFATPAKRQRVLQDLSDTSSNTNSSGLRTTKWLNHTPVKTPATIPHHNQLEGRQGRRSERGACRCCGRKVSFHCPTCEPGNANRHWVCNRNECAARHKTHFNEMRRVICNNKPMSAEWMSTITKPGFGQAQKIRNFWVVLVVVLSNQPTF